MIVVVIVVIVVVVAIKGVFPVHVMKGYRGSRGSAPQILNLGTKRRKVVNFTPRPLYPSGKNPRRLGGLQSLSECSNEEKISCPPGFEPWIV
jgi:hypothetical protein